MKAFTFSTFVHRYCNGCTEEANKTLGGNENDRSSYKKSTSIRMRTRGSLNI